MDRYIRTKKEFADLTVDTILNRGFQNKPYSNEAEIRREFNRIYRKIQQQTKSIGIKTSSTKAERKQGIQRDINISAETYRYMTNQTSAFSDVALDDEGKANIDLTLQEYVKSRFANMASKYSQINEYLDWYLDGEITYQEFMELVKDFRQENKDYLKENYRGRTKRVNLGKSTISVYTSYNVSDKLPF